MEIWGVNGQALEPCEEKWGTNQRIGGTRKEAYWGNSSWIEEQQQTGTVMRSKGPPPSRQASPTP